MCASVHTVCIMHIHGGLQTISVWLFRREPEQPAVYTGQLEPRRYKGQLAKQEVKSVCPQNVARRSAIPKISPPAYLIALETPLRSNARSDLINLLYALLNQMYRFNLDLNYVSAFCRHSYVYSIICLITHPVDCCIIR